MSRLFLRSSLLLLVTGLPMWSQTVFAQDRAVEKTAEKVPQGAASKAVIFTTRKTIKTCSSGSASRSCDRGGTPTKRYRMPPIITKLTRTLILTCRTS